MSIPSLAHAFAGGSGGQSSAAHAASLDDALREALRRAQKRWDFTIDPQTFAAYLGERFDAEAFVTGVASLPVPDLFVACGCLHRDADALRAFTDAYGRDVLRVAARTRHEDPDELLHQVHNRLLVGSGGVPGLSAYAGRGALRSFVRVTALRLAADRARADLRAVPVDRLTADALPAPDDPPELAYLKSVYQRQFRAALAHAVEQLSARDRNVLRYRLVENLDPDQIGALYDVSATTIRRWIQHARGRIGAATRQTLLDRFALPLAELDSVLRLLHSRLGTGLVSLLR